MYPLGRGTHKHVAQQTVDLDVNSCFDAFLREVWVGGGGLPPPAPKIVKEGDAKTGAGCLAT